MSSELLQTAVAIATLVVIVVGVTVAIVELRQEVLARRLQGISALFSAVWPEEARKAAFDVAALEPGFDDADVTPELRGAVMTLLAHYDRVGFLLHQGLVKEREILAFPAFGVFAAEYWLLVSEYLGRVAWMGTDSRKLGTWWEYLALRADAYWHKEGRAVTASAGIYSAPQFSLMNDMNAAMAERPAA